MQNPNLHEKYTADPVTGCWNFLLCIHKNGYGYLKSSIGDGKYTTKSAHRVFYQTFRGPIPKGLQLDHLCRNKKCVNPDHLEAVSQRENLNRAMNNVSCVNGHLYSKTGEYNLKRRRCAQCARDASKRYAESLKIKKNSF